MYSVSYQIGHLNIPQMNYSITWEINKFYQIEMFE